MAVTKIATFTIERVSILDEQGNLDKELEPKISNDDLKKMYYCMVLSRAFDEKCINLQRQGKIGTYAPSKGHEAIQVGTAFALDKKDWIFPAYRDSCALLARGLPVKQLIQYWAGSEFGNDTSKDRNNFPISISVGTQLLHAVGVAYASKYRGDKVVALTYFGDGATSEGDAHEAFNFAGAWKTPTIFICQNNQYAISVSRKLQTAAQTIAQKAIAYGIKGIQVDGNDILAVYKVAKEAIEEARKGNVPSLIECETYRIAPHTTSDDPTKYIPKEILEEWNKKDPLVRFEKYLKAKKIYTDSDFQKLKEKAAEQVKQETDEGLASIRDEPSDLFDYVYEQQPDFIVKQKAELLESLKK